eukprot:CAMPEP_0119153012 /NCGR_PEP_ID=MMETSP1310-20130426/48593_1 /TAXON_ID=464262 /ORGANISM="Genus nov. species nov., Strain RCC2339" /LENGTH=113 /DNA_ID=CAMNT_0007145425 /DNA_START=155 /DNA_END=493 /DNA_ORIENTATION=-
MGADGEEDCHIEKGYAEEEAGEEEEENVEKVDQVTGEETDDDFDEEDDDEEEEGGQFELPHTVSAQMAWRKEARVSSLAAARQSSRPGGLRVRKPQGRSRTPPAQEVEGKTLV